MKKATLLFALLAMFLGVLNIQAQTVIATSGGSGSLGSGNVMYFTIGETIINTGSTGSVQLTQGFHQKSVLNVLPVNLITFAATAQNGAHQLKWLTSSETNNDYFLIERSVNDDVFFPLTQVKSKAVDGNSTSQLQYVYNNYNIKSGINYYRLKQFDKDGKYHYSKVVQLEAKDLSADGVQLYPNPVVNHTQLQISGEIATDANAKIIDLTGKVLAEIKINSNLTPIMVNTLPTGTYLLQYSNGNNKQTIKFVKL